VNSIGIRNSKDRGVSGVEDETPRFGKLRRTKPCPKPLEDLISLVNSVPPDFDFEEIACLFEPRVFSEQTSTKPARSRTAGGFASRSGTYIFDSSQTQVPGKDPLSAMRERLPQEDAQDFYAHLERVLAGDRTSWRWRLEIDEVRDSRDWLRHIARWYPSAMEIAEKEKRGQLVLPSLSIEEFRPRLTLSLPLRSAKKKKKNKEEDVLIVEWPPYILATLNQEASRIKECPICGRIFWAGRLTKSACSPRCTNTLNVRRFSENQKRTRRYRTLRDKRRVKSQKGKGES